MFCLCLGTQRNDLGRRWPMGASEELISSFKLRPRADRRSPNLLARSALLVSARCSGEGKFESRLLRTTKTGLFKLDPEKGGREAKTPED